MPRPKYDDLVTSLAEDLFKIIRDHVLDSFRTTALVPRAQSKGAAMLRPRKPRKRASKRRQALYIRRTEAKALLPEASETKSPAGA